jgi:hypothetical protein
VTRDEAFQLAKGYAWGRQDGTGTPTVKSAMLGYDGPVAFALTYAARRSFCNRVPALFMPSVQGAYHEWQKSGGRGVVEPEVTEVNGAATNPATQVTS